MNTVTCKKCATTANVPPEQGVQPDVPNGWGTVSFAQRGHQIRSALLCPDCIRDGLRMSAFINDQLRHAMTVEGSL